MIGMAIAFALCALSAQSGDQTQQRARQLGIWPGVMQTAPLNAITDVAGVAVGHVTLNQGENIRTGVTAIIPHPGNLFQQKVPAAVFVGNAFGKLAGSTQVEESAISKPPSC